MAKSDWKDRLGMRQDEAGEIPQADFAPANWRFGREWPAN